MDPITAVMIFKGLFKVIQGWTNISASIFFSVTVALIYFTLGIRWIWLVCVPVITTELRALEMEPVFCAVNTCPFFQQQLLPSKLFTTKAVAERK